MGPCPLPVRVRRRDHRGLPPDRDAPTTVRRASLKLPDDTHAFSLLTPGVRRVQWTIAPALNIYAILPYQSGKLVIETPALAPAGSSAPVGRPGTHVRPATGLAIQLATAGQIAYRRFIRGGLGVGLYSSRTQRTVRAIHLTVRDVTRQTATATST